MLRCVQFIQCFLFCFSPCIILSGTAKPAQGEKKVVVESRSVEIQTAAPAGLNYQWFSQTGISVLGPSHGLGSVDPTPIAATVISADALESE